MVIFSRLKSLVGGKKKGTYPLLPADQYREYHSDARVKLEEAVKAGFTPENVDAVTAEMEEIFFGLSWDGQVEMACEEIKYGPELNNWVELKPDSYLARLCLGMALVDYGWKQRGAGTINTVTAEGYQGFEECLIEAVKTMIPATELRSDNSLIHTELLQAFVGLGDTEEQKWAYENAIRIEPENIMAHTRYLWACSPRWNCQVDPMTGKIIDDDAIVLKQMGEFTDHWLKELKTPARANIWYHYLQECYVEMDDDEWENYSYSDTVRNKCFALVDNFAIDEKLTVANIEHANHILYTAFDMDLCERDYREIAEIVLPDNIILPIWSDYCDTPFEVAESIGRLIDAC